MAPASKVHVRQQLSDAYATVRGKSLNQLFAGQSSRSADFRVELPGLLLDYSRNLVTPEILALLMQLVEACDLAGWRERLFRGDLINNTEQRAALHWLLRAALADVPAALANAYAEATTTHQRMREFADAVRDGTLRGFSGERLSDVIHIGIGGSHLGPELVIDALAPPAGTRPRVHFLSNVDPEQGARLMARLDPARTLVIVASKTFTTQETLANARSVRDWIHQAGGDEAIRRQFAAVSAAPERATEFGIAAERVFAFQDWVGGRYSLWSTIGLPIAIALGPDVFDALLAGAAQMDHHFREAPLAQNMPVLLAALGVWYADFAGMQSRAVIPYRQALRLLPSYLQQLEMESDGKGVQRDGQLLDAGTAPVTWGGIGTDAQHAFFQLLHQGTQSVPVEFIAVIDAASDNDDQQSMLLANCLAQAEALMRGRSEAQARKELRDQGISGAQLDLLAKHKTFPGNRPSSLLLLDKLDAGTLGMLIALYEHRTFVQACLWNINPFDQMGVELGKQLAGGVYRALTNGRVETLSDPTTAELARRIIERRK